MKNRLICILPVLATLSLFSCEKTIETYSSPDNKIGFVFESYRDSITRHTFVYDNETVIEHTIMVDVQTIGFVTDYDRKISIAQINSDGPQAVAGKHYVAFDDSRVADQYIMPAGKANTSIPIILLRDESLTKEEMTLTISIVQNENFSLGYTNDRKKSITVSDILTKPKYWHASAVYYFCGEYGPVKHRFMIDASGKKINDDYLFPIVGEPYSTVDMGYTSYLANFFTDKLNQHNKELASKGLPPLREVPLPGQTEGLLVSFPEW